MVCNMVYPGTVLTIDGSAPYEFRSRTGSCTAILVDGEISIL